MKSDSDICLVFIQAERITHHARVIVLSGLCLVLLHHTGEAASIGGGAGEVVTLGDGLGPATEKRTTPWVITLQHSHT